MFNKETLIELFKDKKFGYGKWFLYFYTDIDFNSEEEEIDVEILDGIIKLTRFELITKDEQYIRGDFEGVDYIPFEHITHISFGKDF